MNFLRTNLNKSNFDTVINNRLLADDFAQPQERDLSFYKAKAILQIETAIKSIHSARNQLDFTTAIAQANAFINAAIDYEFITLSEKSEWLNHLSSAIRVQTIEESV